MSELATGNRDDALDLVQDAMIKLAGNYANRDPGDWGPLFYRILQSRILDWHRRNSVRRRFVSLWRRDEAGERVNPATEHADIEGRQPEQLAHTEQLMARLGHALRALPLRQQQVFLLRMWEGLSVAQTALAMRCSQGSVKTHYSRALKTLRSKLRGVGGVENDIQ